MRVAVAGGAALATLAAGVALVAPTLRRSPVPPPAPVPPKTLTVEGVVVALAGVEKVLAVRLEDPPALVVYAGYQRRGRPSACQPHTEVRVLSQDASRVRLGAFHYVVRGVARDQVCPAIGRPPLGTRVVLAAPLAGRPVVANDVPVTVHDPASLLRAGALPDGVSAAGTTTFDPSTHTWTTVHAGPRRGQRVRLLQGATVLPSGYRTRRVTVRGRPAVLATVFGGRCVWWTERPRVGIGVCAQADSGVPVPLTEAGLLRVAEDLR